MDQRRRQGELLPTLTSVIANCAHVLATHKSQAWAIIQPPAKATPLTAAMGGLVSSILSPGTGKHVARGTVSCSSVISFRSPPAQKPYLPSPSGWQRAAPDPAQSGPRRQTALRECPCKGIASLGTIQRDDRDSIIASIEHTASLIEFRILCEKRQYRLRLVLGLGHGLSPFDPSPRRKHSACRDLDKGARVRGGPGGPTGGRQGSAKRAPEPRPRPSAPPGGRDGLGTSGRDYPGAFGISWSASGRDIGETIGDSNGRGAPRVCAAGAIALVMVAATHARDGWS